MALINCPECGKQISDKAVSCPECGCPASEFNQSTQEDDVRSEFDKIVDEIFWKHPADPSAVELAKATGIGIGDSCRIMRARRAQWKKEKKQGLYPDTQYCPYCGSQNIESFEIAGTTVTSKANIFGGMYITSSSPNRALMRCNTCFHKWKPKKK